MNNLGKDPIPKLLLNLATPAILAQLVNMLYNVVDRIFIGRMEGGEIAMAGIGISFPIILIISSFAAIWGIGGAPLCAIRMGAGDHDGAERLLSNNFSMLLLTSIVLTAVFGYWGKELVWLFGASEMTFDYAWDYLAIYLTGISFTLLSLGLNPFINTQGFARQGMLTVIIGAATNIILDPIFIFGFDLGVKGAAYATVIAQALSALYAVYFLNSKQSKLHLRMKYFKPDLSIVKATFTLGISPFVMQSTEGIVLIALNTQLARFGGDLAIGAMTIMTSIIQMVILPLRGLGQGLQPIVSFNYGAKQFERLRQTIKLALKVAIVYNLVLVAIILIFPAPFVYIFNDDPTLVAVTSSYIRIYFLGISVFAAQIICQQSFLALGRAKVSIFIALLRKMILLVPLTYILPALFGNKVEWVLTAEPISDVVSATTCSILFALFYRKHLSKQA